jgi:protein-tyrosine-phosphatase
MAVLHPSRRLVLVAAAAAIPALAHGACPTPVVLFVCPAGSVKSAIARETLKRRARERGIAVEARSRGLQPEDHVTPALAASLRADGIDPEAEPLMALTPADARVADILVAFDDAADAPLLRRARRWSTPSWSDYPAAKAALERQMEPLLDELAAAGCGRR